MSDLPQEGLPTDGVLTGQPKSVKSARQALETQVLNEGRRIQRLIQEACREAFAKAQGKPLAKIRPIREVDCRMEALEDLKQGRRGPAAEGLRHLAKVFKRDPRTIRRWVEAGYFPGAYKTEGGQWRIPPASLSNIQLPAKLQNRRLKVPNRSLKQQAQKQFARFNHQFTNIIVILHHQLLTIKKHEQPHEWNELIEQLKEKSFVEFLKKTFGGFEKMGARGIQNSINTIMLEHAKNCMQAEINMADAENGDIKSTKDAVKNQRRYRSAMTATYLANLYGVHRSTIHRWLSSDNSFKRKVLETFATLGNEAMGQEIKDTYAGSTKHPTMEEDYDDADSDPNKY